MPSLATARRAMEQDVFLISFSAISHQFLSSFSAASCSVGGTGVLSCCRSLEQHPIPSLRRVHIHGTSCAASSFLQVSAGHVVGLGSPASLPGPSLRSGLLCAARAQLQIGALICTGLGACQGRGKSNISHLNKLLFRLREVPEAL